GLVLGDRDLADPAARPRGQQSHVARDLEERDGHRAQRPVGVDERVACPERLELVRSRHEGMAGELGELSGDAWAEFGVRVQAGADGRAAERQLLYARKSLLET